MFLKSKRIIFWSYSARTLEYLLPRIPVCNNRNITPDPLLTMRVEVPIVSEVYVAQWWSRLGKCPLSLIPNKEVFGSGELVATERLNCIRLFWICFLPNGWHILISVTPDLICIWIHVLKILQMYWNFYYLLHLHDKKIWYS